jgi:hypothetical protein
MGTIAIDCPHCGTQRVSFNVVADAGHPVNKALLYSTALCGHCLEPIVIKVQRVGNSAGPNPREYAGDITQAKHLVRVALWPELHETSVPPDTPERSAGAFREAMDAFKRRNWNSAGVMFRRTLELATAKLDPSLSGRKLAQRIDALADRNLVTPAMKEWAHIIRLDGNAAVHEEEDIDEATATALRNFTETFLLYAFTLPAMVAERSKPKAA